MKELKKEAISKYFNKSVYVNSKVLIATIHQVKGSTLDAILYFLTKIAVKKLSLLKLLNKQINF